MNQEELLKDHLNSLYSEQFRLQAAYNRYVDVGTKIQELEHRLQGLRKPTEVIKPTKKTEKKTESSLSRRLSSLSTEQMTALKKLMEELK
jgi:hypothetical protein